MNGRDKRDRRKREIWMDREREERKGTEGEGRSMVREEREGRKENGSRKEGGKERHDRGREVYMRE